MKEIGTRLLRTLRVERENFVWMDFNDRATGDAFYLVVITAVLTFLGLTSFGVLSLVTSGTALLGAFFLILSTVIAWLVTAGVSYAIIRFGFQEHHNYPAILRISGYAYPTQLLLVFFAQIGVTNRLVLFLVSSVWFIYIVGKGIVATGDLPLERGLLASAGGVVGAIIIRSILSF
jgi:hypothetical protein